MGVNMYKKTLVTFLQRLHLNHKIHQPQINFYQTFI
jgi:hypothetical protein